MGLNCSRAPACGDVEMNRTKYSCCSNCPLRLALVIYTLICFWYCFVFAPDTSSAHKDTHIVNRSSPRSIWRLMFGIRRANSENSAVQLVKKNRNMTRWHTQKLDRMSQADNKLIVGDREQTSRKLNLNICMYRQFTLSHDYKWRQSLIWLHTFDPCRSVR